MASKVAGKKRGPKKGKTKPYSRPLDAEFPSRLLQAMTRARLIKTDGKPANSVLADRIGCERATIGQYLNGQKKTIDVNLLLSVCDALSLSPYWLIKNEGTLEDVALNTRPFEATRKQSRKELETHSERTRGARHAARA